MRPTVAIGALLTVGVPAMAQAQAPAQADLWRVVSTTFARPTALEVSPTAAFFNPAVSRPRGLSLAAMVVETPDVVGLTGIVAVVTQSVGTSTEFGIVLGRVQVADLVRTSTSPVSLPGQIPVHEQTAGIRVVTGLGLVRIGALLRGHDGRFDAFRDGGFTLDGGVRASLGPRLVVAGSTQFVPITGRDFSAALYHAGVEYQIASFAVGEVPARWSARYGATVPHRGGVEHAFGTGVVLAGVFHLDAGAVREQAYGNGEWRPALAVGVRLGRYALAAGRGGSVNDLGAVYRVEAQVDPLR